MCNIVEHIVIETKQHEELSTLQLWQAHLNALKLASNKKKHTIEVFDIRDQSSSSTIVELENNHPIGYWCERNVT